MKMKYDSIIYNANALYIPDPVVYLSQETSSSYTKIKILASFKTFLV